MLTFAFTFNGFSRIPSILRHPICWLWATALRDYAAALGVRDGRCRQGALYANACRYRCSPLAGQTEGADQRGKLLCLLFQGFGGGGSFFHQSRILLRHVIHLGDRLIHLLDARTLLDRCRADFRHDVGYALDRIDHLVHGFAGLVRQVGTHRAPYPRSR